MRPLSRGRQCSGSSARKAGPFDRTPNPCKLRQENNKGISEDLQAKSVEGHRKWFLRKPSAVDLVVWISEDVILLLVGFASTALSSIRVLKMIRVVRLFRVFRFFRQLATLALMVADSVKQLLWALLMFLLIMCHGREGSKSAPRLFWFGANCWRALQGKYMYIYIYLCMFAFASFQVCLCHHAHELLYRLDKDSHRLFRS